MVTSSALTVSQLNTYIRMMFDADRRLGKITLVGEISNFVNHYKTGHCYFSLKDEKSSVKAVMFAANVQSLRFVPENGMRVYVTGRISVFERDGNYQIYVNSMEPEGSGALMIAFEQLKIKLDNEGLFNEDRKKPIPEFPEKIGVVTSPVGAALQDILNILTRRYPLAQIVFCPVAVQGVNCANENIKAVRQLNKRDDIDVILLGRGGGSIEDLWGYNDEQLVRTVAASEIPVITGIGHETDFTLCDFAADLRAPTPSAAAELSVPDILDLRQYTDGLVFRMDTAADAYIKTQSDRMLNLLYRKQLFEPSSVIERRAEEIERLKSRLNNAESKFFDNAEHSLNFLSGKLKLLNPLTMMEKGFVPVYSSDKRVIRAEMLKEGEQVSLKFTDGTVNCEITDIITENCL